MTALYDNPYVPPDFCWSTIARQLLPWNLPACGALLQTAVAVLIIRWTPWRAHAEAPPAGPNGRPLPRRTTVAGTCVALAILLPLIGALNVGSSRLDGTTILANQQDDFDYLVAQHDTYGQQSAGMFGLLPSFVQSLGGEFRTVRRLTPDRLRSAHLLLLLHPNESFVEHQQQIWDYVRDGGSVLIVTDGFHPEMGLEPAIAALLQPTAITVSQDAATSETGDWEAAYWVSAHGATATASRSTTRFLTDHGASLQLGWGARPLVVGQWGWSAPQQGATWNESQPLRTGEKLGDLVMVAEQQIGKGRVVVLGSNAPLTNEGLVRSYAFAGNLLAYLTHDRTDTQASWRQVASILCCLGMIVLLWRNPQPAQLVCIGIILSVGFAATYAYSRYATRVLPDERLIQPSSADDPAIAHCLHRSVAS